MLSKVSARLKYLSGSGSSLAKFIFVGPTPVQVERFIKTVVQVHQYQILEARFRSGFKFQRFPFGLSSVLVQA